MKYYIVDAFACAPFRGNPAAVCIIQEWPEDELMQNIAAENGYSETAFIIEREDGCFDLRWFTPSGEIDLCGHATLASAFVVTSYLKPEILSVDFNTMSGILKVEKSGELFFMDFPARTAEKRTVPAQLKPAIGTMPVEAYHSRDYMVVLQNEFQVKNCKPNFELIEAFLSEQNCRGLIITAKGQHCDFVSRYFTNRCCTPEDPVTGSSHCNLIPYWSNRLEKTNLTALQLSSRGGTLYCEYLGERVKIGGAAALYATGEIAVKL